MVRSSSSAAAPPATAAQAPQLGARARGSARPPLHSRAPLLSRPTQSPAPPARAYPLSGHAVKFDGHEVLGRS
ncbi:hypothetical protein T484DRAFT_3009217 [Baffinella frigidus]|nr:hypothetical protein T484DRAFT_3009217 [Cryptophyta sp. CCMP2293]